MMHAHSSADVPLIWRQLLACLCCLPDPMRAPLAFIVITLQDLNPQSLPSLTVVILVCFFIRHIQIKRQQPGRKAVAIKRRMLGP
jgi:hypothetical protein